MSEQLQWELQLQNRYENLTEYQFRELIFNVGKILQEDIEDPYSDKVKDIATTSWKAKEISFKQWKCLNAFVSKHIKMEKKSFA